MSYEPDCVRERICQSVFRGCWVGIFAVACVVILLIYLQKRDAELKVNMSPWGFGGLLVLGMGGGCVMFLREAGTLSDHVKWVLMLVYLILCSITDWYMQQVYDKVQLYVCVILAIITLCNNVSPAMGWELIVFSMVQGLGFRRMYGDGDVMGFLICALSLVEKGIFVWLLHMGITYIFLGIVQGARGNINRQGNLKVPVPLFPYMAFAYIFVC